MLRLLSKTSVQFALVFLMVLMGIITLKKICYEVCYNPETLDSQTSLKLEDLGYNE
jgi:hypothetical protein